MNLSQELGKSQPKRATLGRNDGQGPSLAVSVQSRSLTAFSSMKLVISDDLCFAPLFLCLGMVLCVCPLNPKIVEVEPET